MKKTQLALGLLTAMLTAGTLAGCDNNVKYSPEGIILSYTDDKGIVHNITADEIFEDCISDSDKASAIFEAIKSIIVRNYFTIKDEIKNDSGDVIAELGLPQLDEIETKAEGKLEDDRDAAKENAANNSTSYNKEFEAILASKGVETEEELREKYIDEIKAETFEDNYYRYQVYEIKNGNSEIKNAQGNDFWTGYFNDQVPYHVSHILVKFSGASSSYWNSTISEEDAQNLYQVYTALANGEDSFVTTAKRFKSIGDEGSAEKGGNLGIMDYATSFVDEFQLGVYTYEKLYGETAAIDASVLKVPTTDLQDSYLKAVKESFELEAVDGIPTVNASIFKELNDAAEIKKDDNGEKVLDGDETLLPRNIIFNKYFNRHSFAFVEDSTAEVSTSTKELSTGYSEFNGKKVLSVYVNGAWRPVLMVRAGTDGYQGIHFIVVNRSAFETSTTVSRDEYFTTYYPGDDTGNYPKDDQGNPKQTYVNFNYTDTKDAKDTAEAFKTKIKNYDADKLNKFIFKKYMAKEEIHIADENLENALNKWIDRSFEQKEYERQEAWEKRWENYVDTLSQQNAERNKLYSQACRIGFLKGSQDDPITGDTYTEMKEVLETEYATNELLQSKYESKEAFVTAMIGDGTSANTITYSSIFKTKGGLCNDGKNHD